MIWQFNYLDVVSALIVLLTGLRGFFRGFVTEFLSMAAFILGIAAAVIFSAPLATILSRQFGGYLWIQVVTFLGIFIFVYILVKLLEGILHTGVEKLSLKNLDRTLGFLLGIIEGVLVISVVLIVLDIQPFLDVSDLLANSFFARLLLPLLVAATDRITIPSIN